MATSINEIKENLIRKNTRKKWICLPCLTEPFVESRDGMMYSCRKESRPSFPVHLWSYFVTFRYRYISPQLYLHLAYEALRERVINTENVYRHFAPSFQHSGIRLGCMTARECVLEDSFCRRLRLLLRKRINKV